MNENKLLTIYGARLSKSGKHINLTLVEGEGENKRYYTACVKVDADAKTHGSIKGNEAHIVVPMLEKPKDIDIDQLDQVDEVPF